MSHYNSRQQILTYTVFHKNRTPKAGRHKFIKISSPKMIYHFSCGFIVLEKFGKGRVPAARFPWQHEQMTVKVWADLEQTFTELSKISHTYNAILIWVNSWI